MIKNICLAVVSLLLAFIILEVAIDTFGFAPPVLVKDGKRGDGYSLIQYPYSSYTYVAEGYSRGRYNRFGLRDYDIYTKEKGNDTYRIAVVGDSFTEALEVDVDDTFENILEGLLNSDSTLRNKYKKFEIINFGKCGWGSAQAYLRYLNEIQGFDVDMVILAFFAGNDFCNNVYDWERLGDHQGGGRPYIIFTDGLDYNIEYVSKKSETIRNLIIRSGLIRLIYDRIALLNAYFRKTNDSDALVENYKEFVAQKEVYPQVEFMLPNKSALFYKRIETTLKIISLFDGSVADNQSEFLLLIIPQGPEVVDSIMADLFEYAGREGFDLHWSNNYLIDFSIKNNIEYLSLMRPFRDYYEKSGVTPYGFDGRGHLNERGHLIAAEELYKRIRAKLMV